MPVAGQPPVNAAAAAFTNCFNYLGVPTHAYSVAFTTCGSANGAYTYWAPDKGNGFYAVDPCCGNSHVNGTVWYTTIPPSGGPYQGIEAGYEQSAPGAFYPDLNQCFYVTTAVDGSYTNYCVQYAGPDPDGTSFWIETASQFSNTYNVYIAGDFKGSFTLGAGQNVSHRIDTGYEEQAQDLLNGYSSNYTRPANFGAQLYRDAGTNQWYYWGPYSHCYVDYNKAESFGSGSFALNHDSEIGPGLGVYAGCDGARPSSPRSNW